MADLYHLLDDEPAEIPPESAQDWDDTDREHLDLPPVLKEAEKYRQQTPEAADEERVDLEDLIDQGALENLPYTQLKQLWTQELHAPELLPYNDEVIGNLMQALEEQEARMDALMEEGYTGNANTDALTASLLKIDSDRVKFLLSSLLKERLSKITKHPLLMRENVDRMSDKEAEFLRDYGTMLEKHLSRTVLDHLPQECWKSLDEPGMIDEPNLDTFVFIRCLDNIIIGDESHDQGACLIVRYSRVRDMFLEGKVELLT